MIRLPNCLRGSMTAFAARLGVLLLVLFAGAATLSAIGGNYGQVASAVGTVTSSVVQAEDRQASELRTLQTVPPPLAELVTVLGGIEPDIEAALGSHAIRQSPCPACSAPTQWAEAIVNSGRDFDAQAPPAS